WTLTKGQPHWDCPWPGDEEIGLHPSGGERGYSWIHSPFFLSCFPVTLLKGNGGCEEHKALPQSSAEWCCVLGRAEVKGQVWTCCPMGWKHFQSSCYYFSRDIMNWGDSETNCTGMGSHLVVINKGTEQDFIFNWTKKTLTFISDRSYYIGLTDQAKEGQWLWVDQTPCNETAA
ncbi:C-type lectin domain family 4 member E-like, partial [Gopherus evgoodei]|uniref:C-type lectin domain family 4 member E-like n=1 Tax=Gopherus evgoodei TaxID=1825980 RepID=UPI0011CF8722